MDRAEQSGESMGEVKVETAECAVQAGTLLDGMQRKTAEMVGAVQSAMQARPVDVSVWIVEGRQLPVVTEGLLGLSKVKLQVGVCLEWADGSKSDVLHTPVAADAATEVKWDCQLPLRGAGFQPQLPRDQRTGLGLVGESRLLISAVDSVSVSISSTRISPLRTSLRRCFLCAFRSLTTPCCYQNTEVAAVAVPIRRVLPGLSWDGWVPLTAAAFTGPKDRPIRLAGSQLTAGKGGGELHVTITINYGPAAGPWLAGLGEMETLAHKEGAAPKQRARWGDIGAGLQRAALVADSVGSRHESWFVIVTLPFTLFSPFTNWEFEVIEFGDSRVEADRGWEACINSARTDCHLLADIGGGEVSHCLCRALPPHSCLRHCFFLRPSGRSDPLSRPPTVRCRSGCAAGKALPYAGVSTSFLLQASAFRLRFHCLSFPSQCLSM